MSTPSPSNCNKCVYIETFDILIFRYFVFRCHGGHKIKKYRRLRKGDFNVPRPQACIDAKDKRYSTKPTYKEIIERIEALKLEADNG